MPDTSNPSLETHFSDTSAPAKLLEHSPESVDHNAPPALAHDLAEAEAEPRRRKGSFGDEDRERLLRGYAEYGDNYDDTAERAYEGRAGGSHGTPEDADENRVRDGSLGASFWQPIWKKVRHPKRM